MLYTETGDEPRLPQRPTKRFRVGLNSGGFGSGLGQRLKQAREEAGSSPDDVIYFVGGKLLSAK